MNDTLPICGALVLIVVALVVVVLRHNRGYARTHEDLFQGYPPPDEAYFGDP